MAPVRLIQDCSDTTVGITPTYTGTVRTARCHCKDDALSLALFSQGTPPKSFEQWLRDVNRGGS